MDSSESSPYGDSDEPLTSYERSRLRASVNPGTLEQFLVATAGLGRRAVIVHFACEVLPEDLPEVDPELAAAWTPLPPDFMTSDGTRFLPHVSIDVRVDCTDPALQHLWDRIEGRAEPGGRAPHAG